MTTISPHHTDAIGGLDPASVGTRRGATDAGPVTGPIPVLDLAEGHVHVTRQGDVTVIALDGALDDDLAADVVGPIGRALSDVVAVVLDLDGVTLLDRSAFDTLRARLDALPADVDRCVVAGRLSGRLVLDRWDAISGLAVFTSVADALQARAFASSGYGTGWEPGG